MFTLHIKFLKNSIPNGNFQYPLPFNGIRFGKSAHIYLVSVPYGRCGEEMEIEIEIQIKYECQWHYKAHTHPNLYRPKIWLEWIRECYMPCNLYAFNLYAGILNWTRLVWTNGQCQSKYNIPSSSSLCAHLFCIFNYNGIPIYSCMFFTSIN